MKKLGFFLVLILLLSVCSTASAIEIPNNAYGVISIPFLGVEMPIYTSDIPNEQNVIDAEESALYYPWQSAYRILDHAFSEGMGARGYWNVQKVFAGCSAYLYVNDKCYWYQCYLTALTEYKGDQEYYNGRLITPCSSYDLMIGCCAEDTNHHYIAVFRRLRELT